MDSLAIVFERERVAVGEKKREDGGLGRRGNGVGGGGWEMKSGRKKLSRGTTATTRSRDLRRKSLVATNCRVIQMFIDA